MVYDGHFIFGFSLYSAYFNAISFIFVFEIEFGFNYLDTFFFF